MQTIKIKLDEGAKLPVLAHETDVGYDIRSLSFKVVDEIGNEVKPNFEGHYIGVFCVKVDTGVHIQPPDGYYMELVPNSRITKTKFWLANSVGIIDPDYRGSIRAIFKVTNNECFENHLDYFREGNVIGQLIIRKAIHLPLEVVDNLTDTERGSGGFGSTERK